MSRQLYKLQMGKKVDAQIITLFKRYIAGACDHQELEQVFKLLKNGDYTAEWQQVIDLEADRVLASGDQSELSMSEVDNIYNGIADRLPADRKSVYKLWPRIAAAASIALAIGIGSLFFINKHYKGNNQQSVNINDVDPGKIGATLTLASGKKIRLSDAVNGELTNEAGVSITKTKNGQLIYELKETGAENNKFNTLSTSNGETYQVRLPDGSAVWLNAASSLTYSAKLIQNGKRSVTLSGEAYFQVAKDKSHPFVVSTAGQQVEVLGTHFNVNAYADEPITATTLVEGSVKVSSGSDQQMLKPGFQAKNNGKAIKIAKANMQSVTDWKDGEFNLDDTDFRMAMRKISRWYDVEVIYDKSVPTDIEAWGWIPRDSKLSSILKLIENSGQVKFRLEGKKVYVYK